MTSVKAPFTSRALLPGRVVASLSSSFLFFSLKTRFDEWINSGLAHLSPLFRCVPSTRPPTASPASLRLPPAALLPLPRRVCGCADWGSSLISAWPLWRAVAQRWEAAGSAHSTVHVRAGVRLPGGHQRSPSTLQRRQA